MNLAAFIPVGPYMVEGTRFQAFAAALEQINDRAHLRAYYAAEAATDGDGDNDNQNYDLPYRVDNGVAVISIEGMLSKQGAPSLGLWGMQDLQGFVRQAKADPAVQKAMLVIDSPGGTVSGAFALAADIANLANAKPTFAYISDCGCSGGYLMASQCNRVYCNSTAHVGSVGVIGGLLDDSKKQEDKGNRYVFASTGALKAAGYPGQAITPEQEASLQAGVDVVGKQFFAAVQKGRSLTDAQMTPIKDAGVHVGSEARAMGLVDKVTTFDIAMAELRAIKLK